MAWSISRRVKSSSSERNWLRIGQIMTVAILHYFGASVSDGIRVSSTTF
jgi:hypothetical protein|tara:strand:+ start:1173 stop:1319 length:147 start_codon:yes stop_codon:yes gene_type:complete